MHQINMSDVTVAFPQQGGPPKTVIGGVSLRIRQGEFVSIVGPSGSGKTTLMRMPFGAQLPTTGIVTLDGKPVTGIGRDCGMVYQKYSLFPHISVVENIAIGPHLKEVTLWQRILHTPGFFRSWKTQTERARGYLTHFGLTPGDADKYPHELSGGMRQRVAIAQALVMKPKVLLMDEPFGALDDRTREQMQVFLLRQWKEHNMTILFVTHDLEEAIFLATRVIGLSQYWTHDDGRPAVGAKIVTDIKVEPGNPDDTEAKYTPQFTQILERLRKDALDPTHCQAMSKFDLTHPDTIRPA